jgi:hypothetical protein
MARFDLSRTRFNFNIERRGKEWNLRVLQRAQSIFSALLGLLPSNYISSVQGPNYTLELKAVAVELAKIELAIEDINLDVDFNYTRSDFLYSIIGYLVFLNGRLPPLEFDDEEFRTFLLTIIRIYFQGSIPDSMRDATALFLEGNFEVVENFLLERLGASGFDISDQFGFRVDITTGGTFPPGTFEIQKALKLILDVIRPAHTLFRIRYIFEDNYNPNDPTGEILDAYRWRMADYHYEDFRAYWCAGIKDRDRLGRKENSVVTDEDHSSDF